MTAQVVGVVPARGGSKGLPGKNLAQVAGRPLLAYTAEAARASRHLSRTIASTDDDAIAEAARQLGLDVPFRRPAMLATDTAPMLPVLQHALEAMRANGDDVRMLVLLQPTSPLRRGEHIDTAIELLDQTGADSVVSVVEVPHQFTPGSQLAMADGRLTSLAEHDSVTRRQDKPRLFARNGPAVLAVRADVIAAGSLYGDDSRPLVMAPEDSLDIDTPFDLHLIELLLRERQSGQG